MLVDWITNDACEWIKRDQGDTASLNTANTTASIGFPPAASSSFSSPVSGAVTGNPRKRREGALAHLHRYRQLIVGHLMDTHVNEVIEPHDGGFTVCRGCKAEGSLAEPPRGECPTPYKPDSVLLEESMAREQALQRRLNAADQPIEDLKKQLAPANSTESRMITLSGCEFSEYELICAAVRIVTGTSRRGALRWVAMMDAFYCGSGVAHALCRRFGYDPDETVKP